MDDFALFSHSKRALSVLQDAIVARLERERLRPQTPQLQIVPTHCGVPWLGFVVYPTQRLLKRRNAVNVRHRLECNLDAYQAGAIWFAELDASVQGGINHVRYADTWGLREHLFAQTSHPLK